MRLQILSIFAAIPALLLADRASDLDAEIKQFKQARDLAKSQAYMAGSRANQFLGQNWVDYQQAIRAQERYENDAKLLDEKVKELEQEKASLQKK